MRVFYVAERIFAVYLMAAAITLGIVVSYAATSVNQLSGKVIVVDAGHGGIDPGANRPGVLEKDINLAIAIQLKDILNSYGAKVILSRESDTDLSENCDNEKIKGRYRRDLAARLELVEESDADIFISIHANSSSSKSRRGAESFYAAKSQLSKNLADCIQKELRGFTKAAEQPNPGDYFVLRRNKIPAVLIEVGYITNADEKLLLQSSEHQRKLAEAIAKGISKYYSIL